jgi:hypothetical protein
MGAVRCLILAVALVGSSLVPAATAAQADRLAKPRDIRVRMSATGVHVRESLACGRYRIHVRAPRRSSGILVLVKPDRGYTRADLRADDRRRTRAADRRIQENLRFFGGVEIRPGGSGVLWETLYAGRYWLVGLSDLRRDVAITTVHVHGGPFASTFPRVSAHATHIRRGIPRVTRRMPHSGRILVRNPTRSLESMLFLRLAQGVSYREFLRAVRRSRHGFPLVLSGAYSTAPLSPNAGYVLRYRLRPGTYVAMGNRGFNALFSPRHRRLRQLVRPVRVHGSIQSSAHGTAGMRAVPRVIRRLDARRTRLSHLPTNDIFASLLDTKEL